MWVRSNRCIENIERDDQTSQTFDKSMATLSSNELWLKCANISI